MGYSEERERVSVSFSDTNHYHFEDDVITLPFEALQMLVNLLDK